MADSIDKGGLRYGIEVADSFSTTTQAFRAEIASAKAAWEDFKASAANPGGTQTMTTGMKEFVSAAKSAQQVTQDFGASLERQRSGEESLIAAIQKKANALATERAAVQQGIDLSRLKGQALSDEEKAANLVAKAAEKQRVAELAAQIAAKQGVELSKAKADAFNAEAVAREKLVDAENRLAVLTKTTGNDRLKQLQVEEEVIKRIAAADKERAVTDALQSQGRTAHGGVPIGTGRLIAAPPEQTIAELAQEKFQADLRRAQIDIATDSLKKNSAAWQSVTKAEEEADQAVGRVGTSIGRIVTAFVAFEAIRVIITTFKSLVDAAFSFNSEIEKTSIALGAIFVAAGSVSDATGKTVTNSRAFAIAQQEAVRQTELLRQGALSTRASFEDLIKTFQVGLAPGLQAGFNVDQIRALTVQMSEAASALGLEQNQLASEIRQILQGTITPRTNRLATALGLSNEDIKRARAAGDLADFLDTKFKAFNLAGQESLNTVDGLFSKIRDVFSQILGLGTQEFFQQTKVILQDIFRSLTVTTPDGLLKPNPAAIQFVKELSAGATEFLAITHEVVKSFDLSAGLRSGREALAAMGIDLGVVNGIVKVITGSFKGVVFAIGEVRSAFTTFKQDVVAGEATFLEALGVISSQTATQMRQSLAPPQQAAQKLSDTFSQIPGRIRDTLTELEDTAAITRQLEADTKKSGQELAVATATIGLGNDAMQVRKTLAEATFKAEQDSLAINQRIEQEKATFLGLQQQQVVNASAIISKSQAEILLVNQLISFGAEQLRSETALGEAKDKVALAEVNLQKAREKGNDQAIASATFALKQSKDAADAAQKELDLRKRASDEILKGVDPQLARDAQKLAVDRIALSGQVRQSEETIKQLYQEQLDIQTKSNVAVQNQIAAQAILRAENLRLQNQTLPTQVASEKQIAAAKTSQDPLQLQTAEAQAQVDLGRVRLAQQDAAAAKDVESLKLSLSQVSSQQALAELRLQQAQSDEQSRQAAKDVAATTAAQTALASELQQKLKNVADTHDLETTKIQESQTALERLNSIAERPITTGIQQAFVQFQNVSLNLFNGTIQIMQGAVQGLASFISDAIVDAFDPTKKVDIVQRFAQFLQQLAKLVIQTLVQIAVASAVANVVKFFVAGGAVDSSGTPSTTIGGFARGGRVPAHYSEQAQGLALGGFPRPRWIPASDTVPAWLTPGEWVMKVRAVQTYGAHVMNAINEGLVNPTALQALASDAPDTAIRAPRAPAFAAGGLVADALAQGSSLPPTAQAQPVVQPVLVTDEKNFSRMLQGGGRAALNRHIRENASEIEGYLAQVRRGGR